MAIFTNKFDSVKQDWTTPPKLFHYFDSKYDFVMDLAASAENKLCPLFFDETVDSLKQSWDFYSCWLNPPYKNMRKFIEYAHNENNKHHNIIALLIPVRSNTNWWHEHIMMCSSIYFLRGRPKFGDNKHGLPQPLCVAVFDGKRINNYPEVISLDIRKL